MASRLWCLLPAERASSAVRVAAAGALPVVDLLWSKAEVPPGVAVRVADTADAPGDGLVIAQAGPALPGRECWRELDVPGAVPEGYAGVVLRGRGSGGQAGEFDVLSMVAALPDGTPVVLDWPGTPDELPAGVSVLLSDVVLPALELPAALAARLDSLSAADFSSRAGFVFHASIGSPARRRLSAGEAPAALAVGHFSAEDPRAHVWPVGPGVLVGAALLRRLGTLEGVIGAFAAVVRPERAAVATVAAEAPTAVAGASATAEVADFVQHAPVAIIGLGCRLPKAPSPARLWEQLVAGFDGIVDVPPSRWDPALYWNADPEAVDRTYARIGGFVTDFQFNPRRFRIPPNSARLIDPIQQMALEAAADALDDAGHGADRTFDRDRVAVILGNSMGGEITHEYTIRVMFPALRKALEEVPGFAALPTETRAAILAAYEADVKAKLPPITEDSMPGELSNVVAGRITNALNLGGPNFTTDAACAGSMAAIQAAVKGLQDGDFDLALTGGADRSMGVATFVKFCKIGALSPDGSRPFDAGANGFVMGEGTGILVLKRLSDAERDGDRAYAVIRGIGASSDGKGKGITAPNPVGQARALARAYGNAGVDPRDVDLFECHGTSTVVGDKVEVGALSECVGRRARGAARIGSIKSNIGHLKSAAGAASMLKAALALHHKVYPPTINYKNPRPDLDLGGVPLQVQTAPEAWESGGTRMAGVSSFGFGGTNFHVVLQEWRKGERVPGVRVPGAAAVGEAAVGEAVNAATVAAVSGPGETSPAAKVAAPAVQLAAPAVQVAATADGDGRSGGMKNGDGKNGDSRRPSAAVPVPPGIWALSADTPEEMVARCRALKRGQKSPFEPDAPLRLAAAAENDEERAQQLDKAISALQKGKGYDLLRSRGIYLEDVPCDGQLAFLFTGQGSQYVGMGLDLAAQYPIVADTFREADEVLAPLLGRPLTEILRRDPSRSEDDQFEELRATEISQPATLTVDVAILRLLAAYNVRPDVVAGHSLGEYGAAVAAGMLSFRDALLAVSARGREMAAVKLDDFGKMAGIATSVENVESVLAEIPGYVVAANKNCPTQTVIAGESDAVDAASEAFKSRGVTVYPLPVSHAFHSRIVAPASDPLRRVLERLDLKPPVRRITSNVDSRYYPTGEGAREKAIDILARQVASPVEWIAQIERMYNDGARIFVECGPKRALTGFVVNTLKHRPHRAIYTNQPKRGGVLSFHDGLASLLALGFQVAPEAGRTADLFATSGPRRSTSALLSARAEARSAVLSEGGSHGSPAVEKAILQIIADRTGYPVDALDLAFEWEADLGIDTVKLADIVGQVREHFRLDEDPTFKLGEHRTLRSLIDYAGRRVGATRPAAVPARRAAVPEGGEATLGAEAAARFLTEIAQKDLRGLDPGAFAEAMLPALQGFLAASWQAFQVARGPDVAPVSPAATVSPTAVSPAATGSAATATVSAATGRAATVSAATVMPASPVTVAAAQAPRAWPKVVCSGASVGLPGGAEVFGADNIPSILRGDNRILPVPLDEREKMVGKGLVRLVKNAQTGQGDFLPVDSPDQVIRLAGQKTHFDLAADYGVDPALVRSLDVTTQLAFAAGLEALRDAGIPLVRTYKATSTGKNVATGWALPPSMRDGTGIVFASAFPGYDQLLRKLADNGSDGEGRFDRRFLFQILAMGHSQFAQFIGARGPNTQVNAACASTTQALSIAEDWLRLGRAERVIVIGADDVTNEQLLQWIGAGFLAAGAATTEDRVENAALPFDRRRHGMILGMGAVGLVLEREEAVRARGVVPIAELLATRITNSAFHGTRLDQEHISREVAAFAKDALAAAGVDAATFARRCVFLSHETYTPARGGSAAAEMASLPAAFGPEASHIVIANTKGFTGHAMGAGIEDTVAVKALQYRVAPPIANLRERDPDLGQLTLSEGGPIDVDYALRLAAGFGSQLALAAWKRVADGDRRIEDPERLAAWIARQSGEGRFVIEARQLRWVNSPGATAAELMRPGAPGVGGAPVSGGGAAQAGATAAVVAAGATAAAVTSTVAAVTSAPEASPVAPATTAAAAPATTAAGAASAAGARVSREEVLDTLLRVVAQKTGYDPKELEPDYELEADLGIDTVKQAEIFGDVREKYGLARDDSFRLSDYPTIRTLSGYLADRAGGAAASAGDTGASAAAATPAVGAAAAAVGAAAAAVTGAAATAAVTPAVTAAVTPSTAAPAVERAPEPPAGRSVARAPAGASEEEVLATVLRVVAQRTGYDVAELDPNYELEADLGIDTVKQAEIFGEVREKYGLARDDDFRLSDYPTIQRLAGYLAARVSGGAAAAPAAPAEASGGSPAPVAPPAPAAPAAPAVAVGGSPAPATSAGPEVTAVSLVGAAVPSPAATPAARASVSADEVLATVLAVVAARTGYEVSELDPNYELEADLGVDTVKQAEIFGEVRERYQLARDDSFRLADYPTIAKLAGYLADRAASAATSAQLPAAPAVSPAAPAVSPAAPAVSPAAPAVSPADTPAPAASSASPAPASLPVAPTGAEPPVRGAARDAATPAPTTPAPTSPVATAAPPSAAEPPVRALPRDVTAEEASFWPTLDDAPRLEASRVAPLPAGIRLRRPVQAPRTAQPTESLSGRTARVLGVGPLADAVRAELASRGVGFTGSPALVVDVGVPVLEAFAAAKAIDAAPPARWLCVVTGATDLRAARDEGARAGLAKALGREWAGCQGRVLTVPADLPPALAAEEIVDELATADTAQEVWRDGAERTGALYATEAFPGRSPALRDPVVLLTGGTRGITARVAQAFAVRGPCRLVLVGRTGPAATPLDEEAAKASIKAELALTSPRVTPKMVEDRLKPLRVAEEVRATVQGLRAAGARVTVELCDLADPAAVRALVERTVAEHGRIDVCIHGAGVEESRKLADKDERAFRRVYDGKAEGGLALVEALPASTFFVSMGSVAGRFGNAGQVDYAAANEAMAQVCRARPESLHVAWTAWADTGMAVRGGMETLLTGRGVELLPAGPGAALVYDLVAGAVTGEVVVAGAMGDFALPTPHPWIQRFELVGDEAIGTTTMSAASAPWLADHAIGKVPVLPGVVGLELMVGVATGLHPAGRYAGAEDVRFAAPLKFHHGEEVTIEVRARREEDGSVRCSLASVRTARTGRVLRTDHFEARIQLDDMPLVPALPPVLLPEARVEADAIYRRFFHGPQFQVLARAEGVALQGIAVAAKVDHEGILVGQLTDPMVLEAALQAAGLHTMMIDGRLELPSAIDAIEVVQAGLDGDALTLTAVRRGDAHDVDILGSNGVVLRVRGYRGAQAGPLAPDLRFPAPLGGWPSTASATSEEARTELTPAEIEAFTARGNAARQADRLAGQLAAVRAVKALAGERPFRITREVSGEPIVEGLDDISVSITHQAGDALAIAVRGARVGLDFERHEPRSGAFAREWFSEREQEQFTGFSLTRAWAVKEAVLKVLGTGMALSPKDVEVEELTDHRARVSLRGEAEARRVALGGGELTVRVGELRGRVVATVVMGVQR